MASISSGDARPSRRPMRFTESVRIWPILTQDRLGSLAAVSSSVSGYESGTRLLAGERQGDDRAGPFVEYIVTENDDRALSGLLAPANRVQISPAYVCSQYSGHVSPVAARPSSASRCSSVGFSFPHSWASRVRSSHPISMPRLLCRGVGCTGRRALCAVASPWLCRARSCNRSGLYG